MALLDIHDPSIVLARSQEPILEPEKSYEKEGLIPNVVFTCGAIETDKEYLIYYGGADAVVGLATINKEIVLKWAKEKADQYKHHPLEKETKVSTEETLERQQLPVVPTYTTPGED